MVRQEIDPYLDRLYNSNVRCPYCKARILKYTTTCPRCGIHKKQIYEASNIKAKKIIKEKTGEKVFLMARKPVDVSFTKMALLCLFLGFAGAHCFYVGRKIRGWFMACSTVIGMVGSIVSSIKEEWRTIFTSIAIWEDVTLLFPTDYFMLIFIIMWGIDFIAIVFNLFKYPVRLGEVPIEKRK
jgi:TM2 domain-containing membrane protein YozV